MRNSTSQHPSSVVWAIAASLAVLGWLAAVAVAATASQKGPGEGSKIKSPAKYDPATVKPATIKPAAVKPATDAPDMDDSDADDPDNPAAVKPAAAKPGMVKPGAVKPPAVQPAAVKPGMVKPAAPRKLRFQFRFTPWKDVLDWFAQQADLSLNADVVPPGTLNYSDDREYTPAEALDVLNGVLLTKGYTLVRREHMLMVINLEDGIPPNLVPIITPDALDGRGEYELVCVRFNLEKLRPEEAEAEIAKLLGPQGSIVPLARARQILVTETAGRLRTIRSILARIEEVADDKESLPDVLGVPRPRRIPVQNTPAQEMAELVRQVYSGRVVEGPGMLRGGTGRAATPAAGASSGPPRGVGEAGRPGEESLRITVSVDARTNSLLVVAPRAMFQEIKQLVEELDQAAGNQEEAVRVVPLHGVTAEAVQQALSAAAGDLAQFGARVPVAAPSTPAVPGKPAPRGQGAGVASGLAPRSQPARTPYSRGRPAAPDSAAVP